MNTTKNKDESQRVGQAVEAKKRQCYHNAMQVIWCLPEYADADYVEGMAVCQKCLTFEHGWVERNGVVIDPTLPTDELAYFPGLRFTGGMGIAEATQIPKEDWCEDLPIFYRFGWGGIESSEFRAAIAAAHRYSGDENVARRYEEWTPLDAVTT